MENIEVAKYLYEMGYLKQVKRAGWGMLGITQPESVAEHSFRTAIIGYVLASLADADPQKTATMCLFHDTAEALRRGHLSKDFSPVMRICLNAFSKLANIKLKDLRTQKIGLVDVTPV